MDFWFCCDHAAKHLRRHNGWNGQGLARLDWLISDCVMILQQSICDAMMNEMGKDDVGLIDGFLIVLWSCSKASAMPWWMKTDKGLARLDWWISDFVEIMQQSIWVRIIDWFLFLWSSRSKASATPWWMKWVRITFGRLIDFWCRAAMSWYVGWIDLYLIVWRSCSKASATPWWMRWVRD